MKNLPAILAYIALVLVVLGALSQPWYIYETLTMVPTNTWADAGPGFVAFFGVLLASAGALAALIFAIIAEFTGRPRYLWIAMIVAGLASLFIFLGSYYFTYKLTDDRRLSLDWSDLLIWLVFLLPLVACVTTGVAMGLKRKHKSKV